MSTEIKLLAIDKEEATVAEQITVYKRTEVNSQILLTERSIQEKIKQLTAIQETKKAHNDILLRLGEEEQRVQKEKELLVYKNQLYTALKREFDNSYPLIQEQSKEEIKNEYKGANTDNNLEQLQ